LKRLWLLTLLPVAALIFWAFQRKTEPPKVLFSKAVRETLNSTLSTNGKIEPLKYSDVRVETSGLVKRLLVHQGDAVKAGQLIAELSDPGLSEDLQANEARAAQAGAELETLRGGGRSSELAEIQSSLNRLQSQRETAQTNLASLDRLQKANAATRYEVDQARHAVEDLDAQIRGLMAKRAALVDKGDVDAAKERLREAEANVELSRTHMAQTQIRSPLTGIVYDLPAREGAYLRPGDAVASVGTMDPVRVRVYVDEPELGRVSVGQPVKITWDALPGRDWTGVVEKKPTEIVALGARQVGEVLCTIGNPGRELTPGTNVNAFILTQVAENALAIPKTAVRRESGTGVLVLQKDNTIRWQPVQTGIGDALRVQVLKGLVEGDAVAEPSDVTLKDGMTVNATVR
jgi:HlyD family secretion protein